MSLRYLVHARFGVCLLALALAIGCTPTTTPAPPPTLGLDNPKSLATVYISPTPDLPTATPTPDATSAGNPQPWNLLTPTATPFVGIFLGNAGEIVTDGTLPPAANVARPTAWPSPPGNAACGLPVAAPFQSAWTAHAALKETLGCPVNNGFDLRLVHQPFERGHMFYRDTGNIYAISEQSIRQGNPTDIYWQLPDSWQEGQAESDPSLTPPDGLLQPIRGFGNVWRNTPSLRDVLGWATAPEEWIDAFWQDFEGGWMLRSADGRIFGLTLPNETGTGAHFGGLPGG